MWQFLDTMPGSDLVILGCAYIILWGMGMITPQTASGCVRLRAGSRRRVGPVAEGARVDHPDRRPIRARVDGFAPPIRPAWDGTRLGEWI